MHEAPTLLTAMRRGTFLDSSRASSTLGEELPKEMTRVRDELMPQYQSIGPAGGFALALMRTALDGATKALAAGDLPSMIRYYNELKDFKS